MIDLISRKLAMLASTNASSALTQATANGVFKQSGTSAVTRTVQDRLLDSYNLYDYLSAAQIADVRAGTASIDIAPQLQALADYLKTQGGGSIIFGYGCALLASPVRLYNNVALIGGGGSTYGFVSQKGASSFKQAAAATGKVVMDAVVTAGGSGYTSATITFSNGATGLVSVSGGAVVGVTVTDCGLATTATITATITGNGTGATVAAQPCVPMFYQAGTVDTSLTFRDITLIGNNTATSAGVLMSNTGPWFYNYHAYLFGLSAWKRFAGAGGQINAAHIFGCGRGGMSPGTQSYYCGALDENGNDLQICNVEIGANYSGDTTNLWNSAIHLGGTSSATQLANVVAEGADVGIMWQGGTGMAVNVRCDINYGHGVWMHRTNPVLSPPWSNKIWGLWCHRNSKYGNNLYDNLRIEAGDGILYTTIVGYSSSSGTGDGWAHRYGLYDGANFTTIEPFTDTGALTAKFAQSTLNNAGPVQSRMPLGGMAAASSLNVTGLRELRITNGSTATTINTLTGCFHGDELVIQTTAANVTLAHGGTASNAMFLAGAQSRVLSAFETVYLRNLAGAWFEVTPWTKQAAITSPTADVTALKTAVDAIRTTLQTLGMTS